MSTLRTTTLSLVLLVLAGAALVSTACARPEEATITVPLLRSTTVVTTPAPRPYFALVTPWTAPAGGVQLVSAGPALAAIDPIRQPELLTLPGVVKLHPIVLNAAAFGADVLTVEIDGKVHRFYGQMAPSQAVTKESPEIQFQTWEGTERRPGDGVLSITKFRDGGAMIGVVQFLPARRTYAFYANGVMIERNLDLVPPLPPTLGTTK